MLTAEQVLARRSVIGSSDAAAILGVDPFRSAWEVWAEKVLDLDPDRLAEQEAVEIGNDFEAPLLAWAGRRLGEQIECGVRVMHPAGLPLAANLDARVVGKRVGLEAKTTSLSDEWGDEGTDQVPERVIVQAHHQMAAGELEVVWVPVLLARRDRLHRALYRVERNERLVMLLEQRLVEFWERHVCTETPPPLQEAPPLEILKRIRRIPGSTASVEAALVAAWESARDRRLAAEKEEERRKAELILSLGPAEAAEFGDPARIVTFLEQSRTDVDRAALRSQHPAVYAAVERRSTYRVLRVAQRR